MPQSSHLQVFASLCKSLQVFASLCKDSIFITGYCKTFDKETYSIKSEPYLFLFYEGGRISEEGSTE